MKGGITLFSIIISFSSTVLGQQRYISSAIIAYSGKAYERTLKDINIALEGEESLDDIDKSKAYYYRAMSLVMLYQGDQEVELPLNPYLRAYEDFTKVKSFNNPVWIERANVELDKLFDGLMADARRAIENANADPNDDRTRNYILRALNHVNAAQAIKENYETNEILGSVYLAYGNYYLNEDPERAPANYKASIRFYEKALRQYEDCIECLDGLIEVAEKTNDRLRREQYQLIKESY